MGCHANVSYDKFPKQGAYLGKRCEVCFYYDTTRTILGTVVRDDMEEPYLTIIRLDDGRYVRAGECQYNPLPDAPAETPAQEPSPVRPSHNPDGEVLV